MADWLLIRLPRTPQQPATWLTVDPRGNPSGPPQSGPLSLAAPRGVGRRICVLVPGTDVLLTEPEVPMKAGTKLHQVVPFALEEQLADDIDDLHFAIGKRAADSAKMPVAVVRRSLMDEWLTALRSNGLDPESMYTESDLLPQNPGQAIALMEEDVVVVRPPSGSPVTLPVEALGEALEIAQQGTGDQAATGGRGLILYTGAAEWHQHSAKIEALRERFDGIKIQLLSAGPLALFGQQLPTASPINLLQGSYAPTKASTVGWQSWKIAAILLVCLIGLHVAGKAAELTALKRSEHTLDASIGDTFRQAMPGETNSTNARQRMEQRLAAAQNAGGPGGLLPALQALVDARAAAPGAKLKAMSYRQGTVDMKISAKDATSLDHLSQSLKSSGWQAELTSGNTTGTGYEGRIVLRGK
ncbi:MAG TPA: type II secretion system protein GspL [Steroidobacteraceae bacterium]|nr:type II secretion system protein GspL [Steroidobacteraceae bacterium]